MVECPDPRSPSPDRIEIRSWKDILKFPDGNLKYRLPVKDNADGTYSVHTLCDGWTTLQVNRKPRSRTVDIKKTAKCAGIVFCSNKNCTTSIQKPMSTTTLIKKQLAKGCFVYNSYLEY